MNVEKLVAALGRLTPTLPGSRRQAFRYLAGAALPGLLGGAWRPAYGQAVLTGDVVAALKLALSLEYLEYYFYVAALGDTQAGGSALYRQLSATEQAALVAMRDDEQAHVTALQTALGSQSIADPTARAFDYTAGTSQLTPFASLADFLALAQALEDLGVRAYKGALATLLNNKDLLTVALTIHSVEARHAAHIRTLRRGGVAVAGADGGGPADSLPKSWVSLRENDGPRPVLTAAIYGPGLATTTGTGAVVPASAAEDNVTQARINVQTNSALPGSGLVLTLAAASEAFDEPLDGSRVKAIALSFVVGGQANTFGLFV